MTARKTLFAALAAATAVAAIAAPAAAQSYGYDRSERYARHDRDNGAYNLNARQDELNHRIAQGARRGTLDRREVAFLTHYASNLEQLEARYRIGGLNRSERADLDRRYDWLETRIASESHDRDYGYGYGPRR